MDKERAYDDGTWERLFDFAFSDEGMTREQVQAELRSLGIDMRPVVDKVKAIVQQSREARQARDGLERAKQERPALLAKLLSLKIPPVPKIREVMNQLIRDRVAGSAQAAYFHKLKSAASDEDLKNLLEDILRLEALQNDQDGKE